MKVGRNAFLARKVYRNRGLENTYYNFRYAANMMNIRSRRSDCAQYCIS